MIVALLAYVAGTIAYLAAPRARDAVRANLAIVAPGRDDHERVVRRVFRGQVRNYLETLLLLGPTGASAGRGIRAEGWENFAAAYGRGKGVVLASAHLGSVSVCGQVLTSRGLPLTLPVEAKTSWLGALVDRARASRGMKFVSTDSPLGIRRVLRAGETLGVLSDRAVTGIGVRVPFFGREALMPSAHVALALHTGAALVPALADRDRRGLIARFWPEVPLRRTGDREADIRAGVRAFLEILEAEIRRRPEDWSVFERLWER